MTTEYHDSFRDEMRGVRDMTTGEHIRPAGSDIEHALRFGYDPEQETAPEPAGSDTNTRPVWVRSFDGDRREQRPTPPPEPAGSGTCWYCGRTIENDQGTWVDPEATGDDSVWRETCDAHDTFMAEHTPTDTDHPEYEWEQTGPDDDPAERLTADRAGSRSLETAIYVNGVPMHLEAYRVHNDDDVQVGTGDWADEAMDAISTIDAGDGPRYTFTYRGAEYVPVAFPYCQ